MCIDFLSSIFQLFENKEKLLEGARDMAKKIAALSPLVVQVIPFFVYDDAHQLRANNLNT